MRTILCVEDNKKILRNNRAAFESRGYVVLTAETLASARESLADRTPDAIVLDIMLPDGLGLDLLTELRKAGSQIPVILLTAWGKPSDVARGLRAGANDYLSKPFEYEVLLARVEAMFRNVEQLPETLSKGALTLDIAAMQAFVAGRDMLLTQKEFSLLMILLKNEKRVISAEYLYEKAWKLPLAGDANAIKVQISNLRKKLTGSGYTIVVQRGEGYSFERE